MLINCVVYRHGQRLADIPVQDISEYVAQPDCFVWVALRDATDDELETMREEFGLHELAVEDARHGHQRPKVEEYGEVVFTVMHTIEFASERNDALDEPLCIGEVAVFTGPNFVLSIRNRSRQPLLGVRERAEREPHLLRKGPGYVLYAIMDAVVDRYFAIIDALESELDAIEERMFEPEKVLEHVQRLYQLKQRAALVRHAVGPLLDAVGRLVSGRVPKVCVHHRAYFRDVYDHLERMHAALENLRETINTAIQVSLSIVTIEETQTTKRLAAWAAIFAVATAFAGIWGMNFQYMPELQWRWGYLAAIGVIASACALVYWRFRRLGWL
jgi:magnesium transporter